MKRGDIVTVALTGDHGKPRPAVIVQSDLLSGSTHVALLLLTTHFADARLLRIAIKPTDETGLTAESYAMVERITTAARAKIGRVIGRVDDATMIEINRALLVFFGLA